MNKAKQILDLNSSISRPNSEKSHMIEESASSKSPKDLAADLRKIRESLEILENEGRYDKNQIKKSLKSLNEAHYILFSLR